MFLTGSDLFTHVSEIFPKHDTRNLIFGVTKKISREPVANTESPNL